MFGNWFVIWSMFMLLFLISPIAYGWGYRGWGPPYPQIVQRRRALRAASPDGYRHKSHEDWGLGGDIMWVVLAVGVIWAIWECLRGIQ